MNSIKKITETKGDKLKYLPDTIDIQDDLETYSKIPLNVLSILPIGMITILNIFPLFNSTKTQKNKPFFF